MKKFVLCVLVAAVLSLSGCATMSTVDGVGTPLGALTSPSINAARPEIASYKIILGLITSGYPEFLEATKGHDVDIKATTILGFITTVSAVERQ
ncbi:hypothetical protein FACS1894109_15320 [Spirochaetia bacterium]|nr:hypothetical protein FACS1894109_15320 [Spirochaetia bacterium]